MKYRIIKSKSGYYVLEIYKENISYWSYVTSGFNLNDCKRNARRTLMEENNPNIVEEGDIQEILNWKPWYIRWFKKTSKSSESK
jgi:hypothetical protein